jgi:predicted transposase/invertase (TIGR01784 family)
MPKKPTKPHDEFFKASFGRKDVAVEYLQSMLPTELCQDLDLEQLERVNGSFVSSALQEYFSDVVYQCPLKSTAFKINPCFILEHKSKPESRPHLQLLRYMLDSWTEQLNQGHKQLTPIVPIVVYHGKQGWRKRKMRAYFGKKLPPSLLPYLPEFDYIFTNVRDLSNLQILELCHGLLINAFLMLKHIWEPEYIMENPQLVFINLNEPNNQQDFIVIMLAYLLKNTEISREKVQNFVQTLPKALNPSVMSAYDLIIEEAVGEYKEMLEKERQHLKEVRHEVKKARLLLDREQLKGQEARLLITEAQITIEESRQRIEEARQREEEARQREEEARQREEEAKQKAEEESKRIHSIILNLFLFAKMSIQEIALMVGQDEEQVAAVLANSDTNKIQ